MSTTSERDLAAELTAAYENLRRLEESIDDRTTLDAIADGYDAVMQVLDRWEERATDWDDFEGYMEFRNDLAETLEAIPEDLPVREAFVTADKHVKTSGVSESLSQTDFNAARQALEPAKEYADRRTDLTEARSRYEAARRQARSRLHDLEAQIDDLERLADFEDTALTAPLDDLRDPIEHYNDAVQTDFTSFRHDAPVSDFLDFIATAARSPFVDYQTPPSGLHEYVTTYPVGSEPLRTLLEYVDFSQSKLDHYLDAPDEFNRHVPTNITYLERLSVDPLVIEWPPREADLLRYRIHELISLLNQFATEQTVATLREVRQFTRRDEYDQLRDAAHAQATLSPDEQQRVLNGTITTELQDTRAEYRRLSDALDNYS